VQLQQQWCHPAELVPKQYCHPHWCAVLRLLLARPWLDVASVAGLQESCKQEKQENDNSLSAALTDWSANACCSTMQLARGKLPAQEQARHARKIQASRKQSEAFLPMPSIL
jgi:hypothetical protein